MEPGNQLYHLEKGIYRFYCNLSEYTSGGYYRMAVEHGEYVYVFPANAQEILVKQMAAIPLIDTAQLDMTGYEDVESLDVSNFRIMSIGDLSTDFNEKWDNEIGTLN